MKKLLLIFVVLISFGLFFPIYVQAFDESTEVTVTLTSIFDEDTTVEQTSIVADYGDTVSFDTSVVNELPENYTFAFWVVNGAVRKDLPINHEFVITSKLDLKAVFNPTGKYAVLFMDSNLKLLKTEFVATNENASGTGITLPNKPGYVVADPMWDGNLNNITEAKVFTLQYQLTSIATYNLIINGGDPVSHNYNTVVTITADAQNEAEEYFSHWLEDGIIVSRKLEYRFTMVKSRSLTAVYMAVPSDDPLVTITDDLAQRSGYYSYLGQFYLPQDHDLIEYGFIMSQYESDINLFSNDIVVVPSNNRQTFSNEFLTSFPIGSHVSIRSYLVTKDEEGDFVYSYSREINYYQILNGGFETGNLYGWNAYGIWKNETGMFAWQQSRVISGTYFDGNHPYGRDGSHNLGITWSGASWDQSAERMGHLRSSNFILGGSGWFSFKLGGGRNSSFAYLSVRRAKDHVEVARFGNPNYNNTTIATAQYGSTITNAEAFLFQYYFDLTSIDDVTLGDSLYIMLTDAASRDWSILSADSFITYYQNAPTPGSNQTATNIVPTILNIGTADNTIKSANPFVSGLTNWSNPNSSFAYSGTHTAARSNPTGDGDTGVLRSSAFNISGNQYLRFDWAGGLRYDKQIFITVKEVGTNIEVIRIVRRENLNTKENDGFDNHMVDLSGLDTNKLYYLELSDNRTGSWGVMWVKSIRLVPKSEWDSVTTGDRAVIVNNSNKFTDSSTYRYPLQYTWPTN